MADEGKLEEVGLKSEVLLAAPSMAENPVVEAEAVLLLVAANHLWFCAAMDP